MRLIFQLILCAATLAPLLARPAYAEDGAVNLATYVEVLPDAVTSGAALLERYRDAGRRETGNLRFDVLHEIARPNRFAILEVWRDNAALDGHDKAASTLRFRNGLKGIEAAPYDERINRAIDGATRKSGHPADAIQVLPDAIQVLPDAIQVLPDAIYVLTHVDVVPDHQSDCLALLKTMSIDTLKDAGNVGYEALQQVNRANHFTVAEEWTGRKAFAAHIAAPHTRAFRERLSPMEGALYDQRLYQELR